MTDQELIAHVRAKLRDNREVMDLCDRLEPVSGRVTPAR